MPKRKRVLKGMALARHLGLPGSQDFQRRRVGGFSEEFANPAPASETRQRRAPKVFSPSETTRMKTRAPTPPPSARRAHRQLRQVDGEPVPPTRRTRPAHTTSTTDVVSRERIDAIMLRTMAAAIYLLKKRQLERELTTAECAKIGAQLVTPQDAAYVRRWAQVFEEQLMRHPGHMPDLMDG